MTFRSIVLMLTAHVAMGIRARNGTAQVSTANTSVEFHLQLLPNTLPESVRITLHPDWAPLGVQRFQSLVSSNFFNEAGFFRVVPGFVVQFGLPAQAAPDQPALQDDPVKVSNTRGKLVFATAGANTRTTQLFINLGNNANLDGMGFSPIGEVVQGMEVVDKINSQYGEQPDQGKITAQGNTYLDQQFPNLSKIVTASFV